jgi:hypothetical protein
MVISSDMPTNEELKLLICRVDSSNPNSYISRIEEIIGYDLFYTFSALIGFANYRSEMLLGETGLPLTTIRLIEIGLFVISDNYIELAPEVKVVVIAKKLKYERRLESLQARVDAQQSKELYE